MAHILLSFIGTGDYKQTIYQWGGLEFSTRLFYKAAHHFLTPDHVYLAMTAEAREKYEPELSRDIPYNIIDIPTGGSEAEIWQSFEAIAEAIPGGCRLSVDITHGFRFQPMMSMANILYLEAVKDVEIGTILYGHYKGNGHDNIHTDVVDLTSFQTLIEWSYGVRSLKRFGQFAPLGQVIKQTNTAVFKSQALDKPSVLGNLANTMIQMGQSIEINELKETARLANKIQSYLAEVTSDIAKVPAARPLREILNQLQTKIFPLQTMPDSEQGSIASLVDHLLASGQYQQAITVSREGINLYLIELWEQHTGQHWQHRIIDTIISSIPQSPTDHNLQPLATLLWLLRDQRNQVNHAFVGRQRSKVASLVKNIESVCRKTMDWLTKSDAQQDQAWIDYVNGQLYRENK